MSKAEAGRRGGLETFRWHGREHMAAIGKRGFARFATFARGGRTGALGLLAARGKIRATWRDLTPAETGELYRSLGLP
jgi:hypothetical protein